MTVSEIKGFGRQRGQIGMYRGSEYSPDFLPKTRVEVVVEDGQLEIALRTIREAANTGKIGDGKIFILTLENVYRARAARKPSDPPGNCQSSGSQGNKRAVVSGCHGSLSFNPAGNVCARSPQVASGPPGRPGRKPHGISDHPPLRGGL